MRQSPSNTNKLKVLGDLGMVVQNNEIALCVSTPLCSPLVWVVFLLI